MVDEPLIDWLRKQTRIAAARWSSLRLSPDELLGVAWEALERCRARHDAARGPLTTYAQRRVQGAIHDWVRGKILKTRARRLYGTSVKAVGDAINTLPATAAPLRSPLEERDAAAGLVRPLAPRDREVLLSRFVDGEELIPIGARYGISESGACYAVKAALARLRERREAAHA